MNAPKITRPKFPPGYVDKPASFLTWDWVVERLTESKHYWLSSVRPNGRPHTIPRWGVFLDNKFYYDGSPETRHARNLEQNPHVTLNLEDGRQAIFLEGISDGFSDKVKQKVEPVPDPSDSTQIRPPCTSMMRFTTASPMPVPSTRGSSFSKMPKIRW